MNAVPAKVAGVRELVMASPKPNPLVLAAAALAGVDRVFGIGGAQAVAALAYGTRAIPRVDKIVGPGNAYVAERSARCSAKSHRHARRPFRDPGDLGRRHARRVDRHGSLLAGRTRRGRAGDPAFSG